MDSYQERMQKYLESLREEKDEVLKKNADLIDTFIDFCAKKGIELKENNFDYVRTIGVVACYPNIIELLNDKVQADKEGLYDFGQLESMFSKERFLTGCLFADKYMMLADSYFRRSYFEENNFAPHFVGIFWGYNNASDQKYISLDRNRVRINVDNSSYHEFDTWFGAKFQKTISDIDDGIVKLRPPLALNESDLSFIFGDTYSLDIKWSSKDGIRAFQSEEFKVEKVKVVEDNEEYFPARYVHAEFDPRTGCFRHFDGAIHFYTEEEYYQRRDQDFNYNFKNKVKVKTKSKKLFKINGRLPVDKWIELTSHFLQGNPLIFEYFEGKLPDRVTEIVNALLASREKNSV